MIGTRVGVKTDVAVGGLRCVFELFWEPQSSPIELDGHVAAQGQWLSAGLHHG